MVVESGQVLVAVFVDKIERIDSPKFAEVAPARQLARICLGRIEKRPLLKIRRPYHLHLDNKLAPLLVFTADIDYRIFQKRVFRRQFGRYVLYLNNLIVLGQRQKRVEQTYHQVWMFPEDPLENQVRLGICVFCYAHCIYLLTISTAKVYHILRAMSMGSPKSMGCPAGSKPSRKQPIGILFFQLRA